MIGRKLTGACALCGLAVAGCGSSGHFADINRPPTPIDVTVYVNNSRVSVSPSRVGAGPVIMYVTNAASKTESLSVTGDSGSSIATTGPINPQSSARVQVDLGTGQYRLEPIAGGGTSGSAATASTITPATVHVGKARSPANNVLLQP